MIKQETGGSIVFIASIAGHRIVLPLAAMAYSFAKAGLLQLKSNLAVEWARHGIRVNSISPGFMDTSMLQADRLGLRSTWEARIPMGRIGDPSDLAGAIILFCSPAGRYITGVDMIVDGRSPLHFLAHHYRECFSRWRSCIILNLPCFSEQSQFP